MMTPHLHQTHALLNQRTALVLGLGESGVAMAQWALRHGAQLKIADTRPASGIDADYLAAMQAHPHVELVLGQIFSINLLDGVDLVCLSPGLSPRHAPLSQLIAHAEQRGIAVHGELSLFGLALSDLKRTKDQPPYRPKVIGITGTNGKTTVTQMTGLLCRHADRTVAIAGNISPAMLTVLMNCLDGNNDQKLPDVWVLELSSFQLMMQGTIAFDASVVLNITQDHLDWHGDMAHYTAAKAAIYANTRCAVINRDDPIVVEMMMHIAAPVVTFGLDTPHAPSDVGIIVRHQQSYFVEYPQDDEDADHDTLTPLMPINALRVAGLHNVSNALAALALCRAIGLPMPDLLAGLREYSGEPHRVAYVATINDVHYYDDSKGTNVGATVAAVVGLGGLSEKAQPHIHLIAGGDGKGQDFSPLITPIQRHVKCVYLMGKDAQRIETTLAPHGITCVMCEDLADAVQHAHRRATAGELVLLSPACASLDMFKNYVHRAEVFVRAVEDLA